jgi:hypothetical protein
MPSEGVAMFNPLTLVGFHTIMSLIAIVVGFVVLAGLIRNQLPALWTEVFLATAVITSATGFLFPFTGFLPSHGVGVLALLVLAVTLLAQYSFHFAGAWRWLYAAGIVTSLYFLVFVGIVQAFLKVPALNRLAPTQGEPPFAIAQGIALVAFIAVGVLAARAFRPAGAPARA